LVKCDSCRYPFYTTAQEGGKLVFKCEYHLLQKLSVGRTPSCVRCNAPMVVRLGEHRVPLCEDHAFTYREDQISIHPPFRCAGGGLACTSPFHRFALYKTRYCKDHDPGCSITDSRTGLSLNRASCYYCKEYIFVRCVKTGIPLCCKHAQIYREDLVPPEGQLGTSDVCMVNLICRDAPLCSARGYMTNHAGMRVCKEHYDYSSRWLGDGSIEFAHRPTCRFCERKIYVVGKSGWSYCEYHAGLFYTDLPLRACDQCGVVGQHTSKCGDCIVIPRCMAVKKVLHMFHTLDALYRPVPTCSLRDSLDVYEYAKMQARVKIDDEPRFTDAEKRALQAALDSTPAEFPRITFRYVVAHMADVVKKTRAAAAAAEAIVAEPDPASKKRKAGDGDAIEWENC